MYTHIKQLLIIEYTHAQEWQASGRKECEDLGGQERTLNMEGGEREREVLEEGRLRRGREKGVGWLVGKAKERKRGRRGGGATL